jgi:glycerol uptake facilitator-like aquaporin
MDSDLRRGLVAEGLGTFAVVYFSAGVVCVNFLTTTGPGPAAAPLHGQQPGLVGISLAYGLIMAAALAVTVRLSGGFLNPAVTLMLWVFNRLDNKRTAAFLLVQLAAAFLAGACLRYTFDADVLRDARLGTPHLNVRLNAEASGATAFRSIDLPTIVAGTSAELVLTFFLVFAIFGIHREREDPSRVGLPAGLVLVAGSLMLYPLTGAAANPARWIGTVLWELSLPERLGNPWADTFVYLAGPILGALAAGLVTFRYVLATPAPDGSSSVAFTTAAPPSHKPTSVTAKRK